MHMNMPAHLLVSHIPFDIEAELYFYMHEHLLL